MVGKKYLIGQQAGCFPYDRCLRDRRTCTTLTTCSKANPHHMLKGTRIPFCHQAIPAKRKLHTGPRTLQCKTPICTRFAYDVPRPPSWISRPTSAHPSRTVAAIPVLWIQCILRRTYISSDFGPYQFVISWSVLVSCFMFLVSSYNIAYGVWPASPRHHCTGDSSH